MTWKEELKEYKKFKESLEPGILLTNVVSKNTATLIDKSGADHVVWVRTRSRKDYWSIANLKEFREK